MKLKRYLLFGRKAMTNLVKVLVAWLCPTLWPHALQTSRLLWPWNSPGNNTKVAIPFSKASSWSRDLIWVSCIAVRFSTIWATREVHEKPKQHIKKLRHHSGKRSRIRFFHWSCTDVRVGPWKNWVLKNWCFWTMMLEKTLESPLDCKEIKPVNHIGNQSLIFIGRTDAEAEDPIIWPPDV